VVDFVCFADKLIIELDGPQHLDPEAIAHDKRRTDWFTARGFRVVRFRNQELDENIRAVVDTIAQAFDELAAPTLGSPPSPRRGRDQTSTGDPMSPERNAVADREATGEGGFWARISNSQMTEEIASTTARMFSLLLIAEANNAEATRGESVGATLVMLDGFRIQMLRAIKLDDEFVREANEINDVGSDGRLATKLPTMELLSAKEVP
jgi:hypothetical protein